MAKQVVIGDYGKVARVVQTEISTGTLVDGTKYVVKEVGGTSALPTGAEVGYVFVSDGTEDISASGDVVYELAETDACDISGWSLDFSRSEIDSTTLCDDVRKYVGGMTDITGNISGIYKMGITDLDGGWANKFVDVVSQADNGGTVTVDRIDNSAIVLILYLNDDTATGETETFYVAPVTLISFSSGVSVGENSPFESSLRISPDSTTKLQLAKVSR